MKDFMTRLSDYIDERRNDPEKGGNVFIFCMLGVVILVIVILCLLLLWRKNTNDKKQDMTVETYEEKMETVMSKGEEDNELKQQYLTDIEYLESKIEELIKSLTEIKETMEETVITQEDKDAGLQIQIDEILSEVNTLIVNLQNIQNDLYELTDLVNILSNETIPMILEWIGEIRDELGKVKTDITNIYNKISALETADKELRKKLDKIEDSLKESIEQNLTELEERFHSMNEYIKQVEKKIDEAQIQINDLLSQIENLQNWIDSVEGQLLLYQYDKDTNTLSLMPYSSGGK